MKTRFDNSQLAHVWAQQTQPEGRGSSFFFDGPSIYSYGRHFEIARFVTVKHRRAVLFTTRDYSVTTQRHKSLARRAIPSGVPVFHVPDIDAAARGHLNDATRDYYAQEVARLERSAATRRSAPVAERDLHAAQLVAREANGYAAFYGRRWRIEEPQWSPERAAEIRASIAKERERDKAKRERAERAAAKQLAEDRANWRTRDYAGAYGPGGPIMLRLSADRERIETSQGAHIPANLARVVWDMVTDTRATGAPHEFSDCMGRPRLGQFTLDRINADGSIVAGCHEISYAELHLMALALGFVS